MTANIQDILISILTVKAPGLSLVPMRRAACYRIKTHEVIWAQQYIDNDKLALLCWQGDGRGVEGRNESFLNMSPRSVNDHRSNNILFPAIQCIILVT